MLSNTTKLSSRIFPKFGFQVHVDVFHLASRSRSGNQSITWKSLDCLSLNVSLEFINFAITSDLIMSSTNERDDRNSTETFCISKRPFNAGHCKREADTVVDLCCISDK